MPSSGQHLQQQHRKGLIHQKCLLTGKQNSSKAGFTNVMYWVSTCSSSRLRSVVSLKTETKTEWNMLVWRNEHLLLMQNFTPLVLYWFKKTYRLKRVKWWISIVKIKTATTERLWTSKLFAIHLDVRAACLDLCQQRASSETDLWCPVSRTWGSPQKGPHRPDTP